MTELHRLETLYLVCLDKNEIISKVNKEQQELLKKIQVSLEMCCKNISYRKADPLFQADPGLSMRQRKKTRSCRNAGMCHPWIPLRPDNNPQEP